MSALALSLGSTPAPWLARRDPRLRVLGACAFAVVTVALQELPALAAALATAFATALAAGLALPRLLRRLLILEGFMVVVLASLPFTVPGEPLLALGSLTASREGLEQALAIVLRANAVVVMLLALVGTLEPVVLGHTLARLRLNPKLVHLFLLTVRYLGVLHGEYRRLRLAMRARAFAPAANRHTWHAFGWLVGMLLVRSLERSRRIIAAMKARGFHGRLHLLEQGSWRRGDTAGALVAGGMLAGLLLLEHLP